MKKGKLQCFFHRTFCANEQSVRMEVSVKKLFSILLSLVMAGGIAVAARAAEPAYKGEVAGLVGNESTAWFNYQVSKNIATTLFYDDEMLRVGARYQFGDRLGIKAGMTYDSEPAADVSETNPYGGINWNMPLGSNTRLIGYYDYDYRGKDWQTYEAALRIEMFKNQFVQVGVRGDAGDGVVITDFDGVDNKEAMFFLRGDFGWEWRKMTFKIRPLLYVQGTYLHDYDVMYKLNERCNIMLNINSLYDKDLKYRAGVQFKF